MIDVFLTPMFDSRVTVLGMPLSVIGFALALAVMGAGLAWMLRITRVDGEPRSFRATTHREPSAMLTRVAVVVALALALVAFVATR